VMMPDKFAFEFDQFDIGIVKFTHNFWAPVILENAKFLCEIDYVHRLLLCCVYLAGT